MLIRVDLDPVMAKGNHDEGDASLRWPVELIFLASAE